MGDYHSDPFMQDNFTDNAAVAMTLEKAWTMIQSAVPGVGVTQATFRRPLYPCISEDLFQFNLDRVVPGHGPVMSVGAETKKACFGSYTKVVDIPFCEARKPDCVDSSHTASSVIV